MAETTETTAPVRRQIEAVNRELVDATRKRNAAGMAALYADNATFVGPDGTPVAGKKAIEAMWKSQLEAGLHDADLVTLSVEELGPGVYCEIGKYEIALGGGATDEGRYLVIWKNTPNGRMELFVDFPVSSRPAA